MQTKQLGSTGLNLSVIGFGSFALGGSDWKFSWGPQDDRDSVRAVVRAAELGVNWIDTAPVYGFGHAEEVMGEALKKCPRKPLIATKCGRVRAPDGGVTGNLRKKNVLAEADESLRRLGVDAIDLYQMHWPQPEEQIEEGWDAMARLVELGKVRYIGVSNFNVSQMQRVQPIHPIASLQPDDHRKSGADPQFAEPNLSVNLQFVEGLGELARRLNMSLAHLSLAWVLRRPEVTSAIVGARRPAQIEETAGAGAVTHTPETIDSINELLELRNSRLKND
jgi:aryl-alcohol dehydrogenase-like predicted oxidoreductase